MSLLRLISTLTLALGAFATPLDLSIASKTSSGNLPVTTVHQFSPGTWVEGIDFRWNGKLLVNILTSPDMYQLDTSSGQTQHVTTISNATGLYGITEVLPDQFYVASGKLNLLAGTTDIGSWAIHHVDMSTFDFTGKPRSVSTVTTFATAKINGLTTLDPIRGLVLACDDKNGVVYRVNVYTGENVIVADDPLMKPVANSTVKNGINGIKVRDGALYFTNTGAGTFNKVPINKDGKQTGPGVTIATNPEKKGGDDWTFDVNGNAFIGDNPNNWVNLVRAGSHNTEIIAGGPNSTAVLGPTCLEFGPSIQDRKRGSVYVGFNGGIGQYSTGQYTQGGGVLRLDTSSLGVCQ
ncbi:MAG: hypothetical protein Q9227_008730 [Pyrenula ochraceoflavens]